MGPVLILIGLAFLVVAAVLGVQVLRERRHHISTEAENWLMARDWMGR